MNGRRAWRKRRRKLGCLTSATFLRRHQGRVELWDYGTPGDRPPRPWTARSLVGASMGARKRKAGGADRFHCVCGWVGVPYDLEEDDSDEGRLICPECSNPWADMQTERSRYRIGERLRPCPGCWECDPMIQQGSVEGIAFRHRTGCSHDNQTGSCCGAEVLTVAESCDGSRVIPARKAKR